jgi:hypothetical protein
MSLKRLSNFDAVTEDPDRQPGNLLYTCDVSERYRIRDCVLMTKTIEDAKRLWPPGFSVYRVLLPENVRIFWRGLDNDVQYAEVIGFHRESHRLKASEQIPVGTT